MADLSPVERINLAKEVVEITKQINELKLAEKPNQVEIIKLSKQRVELRVKLGAKATNPVKEEAATSVNEEFGLQASGKKTREKINSQVADIVAQIKAGAIDPKNLSAEQINLMQQYSGRGGLTDNSQFEYFTPTPVASGMWDLLKENGYENGNVLEPSTGAGVFSATKPEGTLISGAELDEVSATVNQALHPEDKISNEAFESMVLRVEDGTYDAVVGNVPFGVRGKEAAIDKEYRKEKRIELYFIRRVIDKVRAGGLITLVVPTGIISGTRLKKFRAEISMKAEFLGAHKLPSKTFGKQGTDVVTDVIVLRKHDEEFAERIQGMATETLAAANVLWEEFIAGKYWKGEGRRFIHGQYIEADKTAVRAMEKVIADEKMTPEAISKRLAVRFESRIDYDMLEAAPVSIAYYQEGAVKTINGMPMELVNGQWVEHITEEDRTALDASLFGASTFEELEELTRSVDGMLNLTAKQAWKIYKKYPALLNDAQRNAVEFANSQPLEKFRDMAFRGSLLGALAKKYAVGEDATDRDRIIALLTDNFERYGHPSKLKGLDIDGEFAKDFGHYLSSIDKNGQVTAYVTGEGQEKAKGYDPEDIASIVSFLSAEGNDAIDLDDIKALYSGNRTLDTFGDMADIEGIAIQPNGFVDVMREFLRGDAYDLVAELQTVIAGNNDQRLKDHWNELIKKLMSRVRKVDINEISFGLRDNWIDAKYKIEFFNQAGWPMDFYPDQVDEELEEDSPNTGLWKYKGRNTDFGKQLNWYMQGKSISFRLVGRGGSSASKEEKAAEKSERTAEYQSRINALEEQFKFFMQSHPESLDIMSTYNMTFNRNIDPEYSKEDLKLKGIASHIKLHWYQNQGVRRLSEEGIGILGHDVGLGKTFQALAFSAYDRQMGRSKKHCIVVPKSVLANWYNESKVFLGSHTNVLFVGFDPKRDRDGNIMQEPVLDENGEQKTGVINGETKLLFQDILNEDSRDEIFEKMHKIPAMTTGIVVMTQERFKMIPLKDDTISTYTEEMVERSMMSNASQKQLTKENNKAKNFAQKQAEARAEFQASVGTGEKKGELPFFEDMNFDRVIIDEAHHYKSAFEVKDTGNVAYLSNPTPSQRAQDMAIKLAHVKGVNAGKGAILLTATPVSNSPIEIFNMLSFLADRKDFERLGIYTPDDFIRFFGSIDTVQKLTVSGELVDRDGLKGFRNLNVLRNMFSRFADMKNAKDVDPDGNTLKLPDSVEIQAQSNMNDEQTSLYAVLRQEALAAGNPDNVRKGIARPMFSVMRDMERVTTDIDLFKRQMTFIFDISEEGKLQSLIADLPEKISFEVEEEDDTGEVVKVKVDTPKIANYERDGNKLVYAVPQYWEEDIEDRLQAFDINTVTHPMTSKYQLLVDNLKAEMASNAKGKQIIFTEEKSQHKKLFRLISASVPVDAKKIGIINADTAGGEKLQEIADAFNRGDNLIIIANKKAEVGVNLQKGTTAIHHLTLPWNPASIQQRNGRGVRQGNRAKNVNLYYYQARGSFDEYRLDLLKNKSGWINALLDKNSKSDTHENEKAMSDFENQALLAENKEEFLAKIAEMQEKKIREERERQDARAKTSLIQLNSAKTFLREFEDRKARALADAQHELELAKKSLEDAIANDAGDDASKRTIERRTNRLNVAQRKIDNFDSTHAAKKAEAEVKVKQIKTYLKSINDKGELPFNEKLVEADEVAMTTSRNMIYKGGMYEYVRYNTTRVFKVEEMVEDGVRVTYLLGDLDRSVADYEGVITMNTLNKMDFTEAHYDESELSLKRVLAGGVDYADLPKYLDKDTFIKYRSEIDYGYGTYGVYRTDSGAIEFNRLSKGDDVLYPDPSDKKLLDEVANHYGTILQEDNWTEKRIAGYIMPIFFGSDWENAISEYIKTAKQEDIVGKARQLFDIEFQMPILETSDQASEVISEIYRAEPRARVALRQWMLDQGYVNISDIDGIVEDIAGIAEKQANDKRAELLAMEESIAEKAKLERFRNDPRFKEVPDDIKARFLAIGITPMYNYEDIARGRFKEFEWFFMSDKNAFNGVLYENKEMLKKRYKATFCGKKNAGAGSPFADTWVVKSNTDLIELLEFLE